tara:strand:- start:1192 stop:1458 length:267 start_codon:yes stop_codon:yes gene_type:complete
MINVNLTLNVADYAAMMTALSDGISEAKACNHRTSVRHLERLERIQAAIENQQRLAEAKRYLAKALEDGEDSTSIAALAMNVHMIENN